MKRRIHFSLSVNGRVDGGLVQNKSWSNYANFTDEDPMFTLARFLVMKYES